jgi:hypothetical protein
VVEAVEVAILWKEEAVEVVVVVVVVAEAVVEVANLGGHQKAFLETFQGGGPLEEVVNHLETKGCWPLYQRYSMEAGRTFTALYKHLVSIGR